MTYIAVASRLQPLPTLMPESADKSASTGKRAVYASDPSRYLATSVSRYPGPHARTPRKKISFAVPSAYVCRLTATTREMPTQPPRSSPGPPRRSRSWFRPAARQTVCRESPLPRRRCRTQCHARQQRSRRVGSQGVNRPAVHDIGPGRRHATCRTANSRHGQETCKAVNRVARAFPSRADRAAIGSPPPTPPQSGSHGSRQKT